MTQHGCELWWVGYVSHQVGTNESDDIGSCACRIAGYFVFQHLSRYVFYDGHGSHALRAIFKFIRTE